MTVVLVKNRVVLAAVQSQQLIAPPSQPSFFEVKCVLCCVGLGWVLAQFQVLVSCVFKSDLHCWVSQLVEIGLAGVAAVNGDKSCQFLHCFPSYLNSLINALLLFCFSPVWLLIAVLSPLSFPQSLS